MSEFRVPLIIRGEIIEGDDVEFGGRNAGTRFKTVDVGKYIDKLALDTPSSLADLNALSFNDILDYLDELSQRMPLSRNPHLRKALELTTQTSGLGESILRACYENLGGPFLRSTVHTMADVQIGIPFLEGWVNTRDSGVGTKDYVRAFGARAVHIVAGNVPTVSAMTIARNTATRSDMIIKTPSNDPLTATAIAQTMIEMAPNHPITKHLSVGYWKGGDERIEEALYQPNKIEKIVAWGGMSSIKHIAKYIQPGIDLITLDPKLSSTIIGKEALRNEDDLNEIARRLALDIGVNNQVGCINARVVYFESGLDKAGIDLANRFGKLVYEAIQALPPHLSNAVRGLNTELAQEMEGLRFAAGLYKVYGGDGRGGVIVSQSDEPVEFATLLNNRVANIVPVEDLEIPIRSVTTYTQTIGIYPPELIPEIRDRLALQGAQRLVTLGYVATQRPIATPQDGIEPLRRMCRWIAHEVHDREQIPYWPWPDNAAAA